MSNPKKNANDLDNLLRAWKAHAPDKKFGGMTLDEFKAKVLPSLDSHEAVKTAAGQRRDAQTQRTDSDVEAMKVQKLVINAIKGDPEFGDDSALYQACGYIRQSEKKSGLSRKTKTAPVQQKAA
jgi:hypothetical protein